MTDHPWDRNSCPENHGGQCFGGGCSHAPAPSVGEIADDEDAISAAWYGVEVKA